MERETAAVRAEWERFLARMPPPPEGRYDFAVATWYTLWSCFVRARDVYRYDAMLMSKKFMSSVWTWDHCFNALAMMKVSRETALQQFLLPFELQAESGTLFDMTNPNQEVIWAVTKPPIHGWCFGRMLDVFDFEPDVLEKVLGHLTAWTNWWMDYRDSDGDGIPEYPQGCDSGWDNSTLFDDGFFLESPDLSAFLVLQMHTCARIAERLGRTEDADKWRRAARELLERLYDHSWVGGRFVARRSGSHAYDEHFASSEAMLQRLGELADFQKVFEAEVLVSQYLEEGRDLAKLRHALSHIMLREDAELHMFQVLEAAFRHYDLSRRPRGKARPPVGGDPLHHRAKGDEKHPLGHGKRRATPARRVAQRARRRRLDDD